MIAYARAQARALWALALAVATLALGLLALAAPNPAPPWLAGAIVAAHAASLALALGLIWRSARLFARASTPPRKNRP